MGDRVLLSTRHLRLRGVPAKLQRRYVGPFTIIEVIGTQAYTLELPEEWKIHNMFHVSLLKPWKQGTWRQEEESGVPELQQEDDEEYEIEKVLRWRYYKTGNTRKKEYLVVWKGWPLSDSTWLRDNEIRPKENFRNMVARDRPVQDSGEGSTA